MPMPRRIRFDHDDLDVTWWNRERGGPLSVGLLGRSIHDHIGVTNRARLGSDFNPDLCRCFLSGRESRIQQTEHSHDQTTHRPPTEID